jgi:hypothetical protein
MERAQNTRPLGSGGRHRASAYTRDYHFTVQWSHLARTAEERPHVSDRDCLLRL